MRTKFKKWAVDYIDLNKLNQFDLDFFDIELFKKYIGNHGVFLEIGPGKGKFIVSIASKNIDKKFIVCELNKTISGIALKYIDESKLENIKLVFGNFFNLGELFIKNNILIDGLFLNFSDPRPKKRHEKRRLTSDDFIFEYSNILKNDGKIFFKSDNYDFSLYSLNQFKKYKYDLIYENYDYNYLNDNFDSLTEFETKFKEKGIKINRFIFKKTKDTIKKKEDLL